MKEVLEVARILAREIEEGKIKDKQELQRRKIELSRTYSLPRLPKNSEILKFLDLSKRPDLRYVIARKPSRMASGVVTIAVMTSPARCPHGKCIYCPGGVDFGTPQSYVGLEPAARRGRQHNYDPYSQVRARIEQLRAIGHPTDKVEIIVMGGTFLSRDPEYKRKFVKGIYDALNEKPSESLEEAIRNNESAPNRCVAFTIETRPDWCFEPHVDEMLSYGTTRVEIGVQTVFEEILKRVKRGHGVKEIIKATQVAKDSGLKVVYHMMPGLPGSDLERDLEAFRKIFEDPSFRPDMLKIYPTLVIKGTELYEMWRRGEYTPYSLEEIVSLIADVLEFLPRWVRIQRMMRDIPANAIDVGIRAGNLRELVQEELRRRGKRCHCIRCREVGHRYFKEGILPDPQEVKLLREDYEASGGEEIFLSFEDVKNEILIGYLRLRIPSEKAHRPEISERRSAIVRELKVSGPPVPLGERPVLEWQHKGYGRKLMEEAERIAVEEYGVKRILVTSGVGVRDYYRKLGYRLLGPYMAKELDREAAVLSSSISTRVGVGSFMLALLNASLATSRCSFFTQTVMIFCPGLTLAAVPTGFPKAILIPFDIRSAPAPTAILCSLNT